MISSEVQRTLVKSPPELWAEISDPASLARHLGEFGEIRITRVEPEQRVEWEAGDTSGSVVIKPSGWGTKVKLTVNRERTQPDETADDDEPPAEAAAGLRAPASHPSTASRRSQLSRTPSPTLAGRAPAAEHAAPEEPLGEAEPSRRRAAEPEPTSSRAARAIPEPSCPRRSRAGASLLVCSDAVAQRRLIATCAGGRQRRRGRRRRARQHAARAAPEPYNALAVWASQIEPDGRDDAAWERRGTLRSRTQPGPALAWPGDGARAAGFGRRSRRVARGRLARAQRRRRTSRRRSRRPRRSPREQVTAVLTGVLDRLGAAHHRPFSRS